jgi:3-oxoacyl-(acyl-carrier-protein) synthase
VILSEGAAVLLLENEEHAMDRGANIMARVLGCGNTFDPAADSNFSHEGRGLTNAIDLALQEASLKPDDIDYISACSNSSKGLDRMETKVIKDLFGARAFQIPISSIKSMIGETFSASGALSLAAAVGVLQKRIIPPTINYHEKDRDCDLDYVANSSRQKQIQNILVTAADPYGQNSAVILGQP